MTGRYVLGRRHSRTGFHLSVRKGCTAVSLSPRLIPLQHLHPERGKGWGHPWRATGEDPQFLVEPPLRHWLPGWRMLEVALEHDQPGAVAKLYLDCGHG